MESSRTKLDGWLSISRFAGECFRTSCARKGRFSLASARRTWCAQTKVFDQNNSAADAEVRNIVAANGGGVGKRDVASNTRIARSVTPEGVADGADAATVPSAAASVAALAAGNTALPSATRIK